MNSQCLVGFVTQDTAGRQSSPGTDQGRAQAWRRAMERQQALDWFSQVVTAHGSRERPKQGLEHISMASNELSLERNLGVEDRSKRSFAAQNAGYSHEAMPILSYRSTSAFVDGVDATIETLPSVPENFNRTFMRLEKSVGSSDVSLMGSALDQSVARNTQTFPKGEVTMFGKINETLATFSPNYLARTEIMPEVASKVLFEIDGMREFAQISYFPMSEFPQASANGDSNAVALQRDLVQRNLARTIGLYLQGLSFQNVERFDAISVADESPSILKNTNDSAPVDDPLRFHVEWTDAGIRVWIGLNGATTFTPITIASQIVALCKLQQIKVATLMCNGKSIDLEDLIDTAFDDSSATKGLEHGIQTIVPVDLEIHLKLSGGIYGD